MTTTLTYYDFEGSRGLECRLALSLAGIAFTDQRLSNEQWPAFKPKTPFGALPVLEHDGKMLAQSVAILRWIGATHGGHPSDPWLAAEHDALMESVEDLRNKLPGAGLSPEEKQKAREAFAAGWLTTWAHTVAARIRGPFVEGGELNVADLKLWVIVRSLRSGTFDHLPATFFDAWPAIVAHQEAVANHPGVKAYFAGR